MEQLDMDVNSSIQNGIPVVRTPCSFSRGPTWPNPHRRRPSPAFLACAPTYITLRRGPWTLPCLLNRTRDAGPEPAAGRWCSGRLHDGRIGYLRA